MMIGLDTYVMVQNLENETKEDTRFEYMYTYKVVDGEIYVYDIDKSGEEDALVLKYKISFTEVEGAKAFVSEDGSVTIYLVEAGE